MGDLHAIIRNKFKGKPELYEIEAGNYELSNTQKTANAYNKPRTPP
jgi:hypothetical protein